MQILENPSRTKKKCEILGSYSAAWNHSKRFNVLCHSNYRRILYSMQPFRLQKSKRTTSDCNLNVNATRNSLISPQLCQKFTPLCRCKAFWQKLLLCTIPARRICLGMLNKDVQLWSNLNLMVKDDSGAIFGPLTSNVWTILVNLYGTKEDSNLQHFFPETNLLSFVSPSRVLVAEWKNSAKVTRNQRHVVVGVRIVAHNLHLLIRHPSSVPHLVRVSESRRT